MNELKEIIEKNTKVDFYFPFLKKKQPKKNFISVIIPVMGRTNFLKPLIKTIKKGIKNTDKKINITIVEHSAEPLFKNGCEELNIDYFWIGKNIDEPFNKSLCHNIGAMLNRNSDNYLFHDLDCLVFDDFFINIIKELESGSTALQTFRDRRLYYLPDELTEKIVKNEIDISDIDITDETIVLGDTGAPGGSICLNKNLFIEIGGYDPELFHGYSPEDMFFWKKMETFTNIISVNNEILHMSHERLNNTNKYIKEMIKYVQIFNGLDNHNKLEFLNYKKEIIEKIF
jgi:hypothetical protein